MGEFLDKVVLINGAGHGIGRSVAEAFAAQGAIVAANDVTPINLDETMERIRTRGGRAKDYVFDVSKKMTIRALIDQVLADWGFLHILVNSAAVLPQAAILTMDEWDWHRAVDINLGGPFFAMQTAARVMSQMEGGVIVNIVVPARLTHGLGEDAVYLASRLGLIGLTLQAAQEFAPYNIRVHALCPGILENEIPLEFSGGKFNHSVIRKEDQAELVEVLLYLCGSDAAHLSGQVIYLDWVDEER